MEEDQLTSDLEKDPHFKDFRKKEEHQIRRIREESEKNKEITSHNTIDFQELEVGFFLHSESDDKTV